MRLFIVLADAKFVPIFRQLVRDHSSRVADCRPYAFSRSFSRGLTTLRGKLVKIRRKAVSPTGRHLPFQMARQPYLKTFTAASWPDQKVKTEATFCMTSRISVSDQADVISPPTIGLTHSFRSGKTANESSSDPMALRSPSEENWLQVTLI
jgi:hypothetical protein